MDGFDYATQTCFRAPACVFFQAELLAFGDDSMAFPENATVISIRRKEFLDNGRLDLDLLMEI